jgi:hypothetical protein
MTVEPSINVSTLKLKATLIIILAQVEVPTVNVGPVVWMEQAVVIPVAWSRQNAFPSEIWIEAEFVMEGFLD